jgi:autotransporter passenger strand-loop-strand repeat protein
MTEITSGSSLTVPGGQTYDSVIVDSGGLLTVASGGSATNATVGGGTDSGAQINGGTQDVFGAASGVAVNTGSQTIETGAYASDSMVFAGGTEVVSGTGAPLSGGLQLVYGSATSTFISSGTQTVEVGGAVSGATVSGIVGVEVGGEEVLGSAFATTISFGGEQDVEAGGLASGTADLGLEVVHAGGSASATTVYANGTETVSVGANDVNGYLIGGMQLVYGSATSTFIGSGTQTVEVGGVVSGATISGIVGVETGGQKVLGSALGTTISAGGEQDVQAGGYASGTVDSGVQRVLFGGTASATTVNLGQQYVNSGVTVVDTIVYGTSSFTSGTVSPPPSGSGSGSGSAQPPSPTGLSTNPIAGVFARAGGTITISGGEVVSAGATASGTTLNSGYQYVAGTADSTVINGGAQYVDAGGTASGTMLLSGSGFEIVSGTDTGAVISGGEQDAFGSATSATLLTGGTQIVASGGIASATVISGGIQELNGGGISGAITFSGTGGTLLVAGATAPSNVISGFNQGDTIDLAGIAYSADETLSYTVATGELDVISAGGTVASVFFGPGNAVVNDPFHINPDSGTGIAITNDAPCFLRGSLILTEQGEVPVQHLTIGQTVLTAACIAKPITWIGTGRVEVKRGQRSAATPVIVRRGALGNNVPNRDLHLTKGHALFVDGVLIPVEFLVNHRSIVWDDHAQTVAFFHIELDTHDVLVANGAPAESYRDDGNRWLFENANSGWGQPSKPVCAPVLTGGPIVDAAWRRLLDHAGPRPGLPLTDDPDLCLLADGQRVAPAALYGGAYVFRLARAPASVRVVSRSAVPAELGVARDSRELGVGLRRIAVHQGRRCRVMEVADPLLCQGFHEFEPESGLRWTDGDATLPPSLLVGVGGRLDLVLHVGCTAQYPLLTPLGIRPGLCPVQPAT